MITPRSAGHRANLLRAQDMARSAESFVRRTADTLSALGLARGEVDAERRRLVTELDYIVDRLGESVGRLGDLIDRIPPELP